MTNENKKNLYFVLAFVAWGLAAILIYLAILTFTGKFDYGTKGIVAMIIAGVILALMGYIFIRKKTYYESMELIKKSWGSSVDKKVKVHKISECFNRIYNKSEDEEYILDDQTWLDLKGNDLYSKIDIGVSFLGEFGLYKILRTPLLSIKKLSKRAEKINWLKSNQKKREDLQISFLNIGRDKDFHTPGFIHKEKHELISKKDELMIKIFSKGWIVVVGLALWNLIIGIMAFVGIFVCNTLVVTSIKKTVKTNTHLLSNIAKMIVAGEKIVKILKDEELFKDEVAELEKNIKACSTIKKNSSVMVKSDVPGDPMLELGKEYGDVLFLGTYMSFIRVIKDMKKMKNQLSSIFEFMCEIEGLISVASFGESGEFSTPEFSDDEELNVNGEGLRHPLVEACVENSIDINGGIIITGSNMSGKSTFLRTVGVCQLMAQTIMLVPAKRYKTRCFEIVTSIEIHDNLNSKKSYYFVEIENLKRIIDRADSRWPVMTLVDEILNGTNPVDRISASTSILNYLSDRKCLIIVATHDMEIRDNMKSKLECFYFTEDVEKDEMSFDYLIRKGESNNRNALKLLRILEYPQEILGRLN